MRHAAGTIVVTNSDNSFFRFIERSIPYRQHTYPNGYIRVYISVAMLNKIMKGVKEEHPDLFTTPLHVVTVFIAKTKVIEVEIIGAQSIHVYI